MRKLGVFLTMILAVVVASITIAAPATAATDAGVSATSLAKNVKKAKKKAKKANKLRKRKCKKAKKVSRKKNASRKAKKRARKSCGKAKKRARKASKRSKKLNRKLKYQNAQYFDVCKFGCKYKTIQDGVNAAGTWQFKNKKRKATVRIQPGTYVEGVLLRGKIEKRKFDDLTIMGVTKNKQPATRRADAEKVILEGTNAQTIQKGNSPAWSGPSPTNPDGDPVSIPANNAIDAEDIDGLVLKNMWGRHYLNNTFFIWASNDAVDNSHCSDFVMDNLVSSDTKSYGLFSRNCFGGKFLNSEGWNHGDSALYIGETPCDDPSWNNRDQPAKGVCQKDPDWTVVDNVTSHQNVLGYSGTNSKYVEIKNSTFYNNGAGVVPNTLDSEEFEPAGWMNIHDNDIFWNNYNYYSTGSEFKTVSNGLGQVGPVTVNYPTGIGIVLYGTDGIVSKDNNIFGNEKWGAMTFSGPGAFGANDDDDAKNLNNQFLSNKMGLGGTDPNGIDFLSDNTGGGNCFVGNTGTPAVTYVLGSGDVPADTIYPKSCPTTPVLNKDTSSTDLAPPSANIQVDAGLNGDDPNTVLGYAAADPPETMECSWLGNTHPAYTDAKGITYSQARANPVTCP